MSKQPKPAQSTNIAVGLAPPDRYWRTFHHANGVMLEWYYVHQNTLHTVQLEFNWATYLILNNAGRKPEYVPCVHATIDKLLQMVAYLESMGYSGGYDGKHKAHWEDQRAKATASYKAGTLWSTIVEAVQTFEGA